MSTKSPGERTRPSHGSEQRSTIPFRILKRVFGFDKVRYLGIRKNHHRLCACLALINLYLHRRRLVLLGA